jgi:hypothetical protein
MEFGYGVVASRRGRGYAPEAARASVRVLEKAGLHRWSDDGTTARFRATAPEESRSQRNCRVRRRAGRTHVA